jgi:hypothetical protein
MVREQLLPTVGGNALTDSCIGGGISKSGRPCLPTLGLSRRKTLLRVTLRNTDNVIPPAAPQVYLTIIHDFSDYKTK